MYEELDKRILAAVKRKNNPIYDIFVINESNRIADEMGRNAFRVTDDRLQSLRKRNLIQWFTKAEDPDRCGGWRLTEHITLAVRKMMEIGKETTTGLALADKQIPPGVTRQDACIWTQDSDGTWNTSCSKKWEFIEGGPTDNEMHFCHHCGGELISEPFSEDLEPD